MKIKLTMMILAVIAAANVYLAIRFRQPMAFVIAGLIAAVMVYCYLTGPKSEK